MSCINCLMVFGQVWSAFGPGADPAPRHDQAGARLGAVGQVAVAVIRHGDGTADDAGRPGRHSQPHRPAGRPIHRRLAESLHRFPLHR